MRLSEICIRRPVMTTLVMASLLLAGFFGYRQLPIAAIPRIEVPTITVTVQYPGASADTMAVSVAAPLERQFATIAGITSITSLNTEGNTQVTLEFDLNRNIDAASLDVQSAISVAAARLPEDLPNPPAYRRVNPADAPIIFLALTSDTAPSQDMNEFADKVMSPRLSTITGVAQINIQGAQKRAVRIKYDLDALATRGISVEDIRLAVAAQSTVSPVGSIRTKQQLYILEVKGAEPTAAFFKPLVVAWRNGAPVRLQDIASVEDSVENDEARAEFNGTRSIIVSVQRQPDANTVAVTDAINKALPEFQRLLPPTVKLSVLSDRSDSIRDAVHDVQLTLMLTAFLVILVILAFLRTWRATFIPALALPLSIIGTFAGMAMFGFSLDNVSLLALTLALGFVVDDAIVVLENIVRYVEQGMKPFDAAIRGANEIGFTVISITISLVAVFIPDPVHGRHRRALLLRIRHDHQHRHPALGVHFPDADAHAGLAHAQGASRRGCEAGAAVARLREGLRADGSRLSRDARCVAARAVAHADRDAGHHRRHGVGLLAWSRRASCPPRTPASSSCARRRRPTSPSRPCWTASASFRNAFAPIPTCSTSTPTCSRRPSIPPSIAARSSCSSRRAASV